MKTPHKHADIIKAWADGAEIEFRWDVRHDWRGFTAPSWGQTGDYRIKPEPKPDTVKAVRVALFTHMEEPIYHKPANLKLTFDGETGKLKSAEVFV
jgi:hypothetical protein